MSLTATVNFGRTLNRGEKLTTAKINQVVKGISVTLSGLVATADLVDGAVTPVKVTPGAYWYAAATLAGTTYSATYTPAVTALVDGLELACKVDLTNPGTGACSFSPNGLAAKPLKKFGGTADPIPNDIRANAILQLRYNTTVFAGGCWEILSTLGNAPSFPNFLKASAYKGGLAGLVPAPPAGSQGKYLRADGTWTDITPQIAAYVTANVPGNRLLESLFNS